MQWLDCCKPRQKKNWPQRSKERSLFPISCRLGVNRLSSLRVGGILEIVTRAGSSSYQLNDPRGKISSIMGYSKSSSIWTSLPPCFTQSHRRLALLERENTVGIFWRRPALKPSSQLRFYTSALEKSAVHRKVPPGAIGRCLVLGVMRQCSFETVLISRRDARVVVRMSHMISVRRRWMSTITMRMDNVLPVEGKKRRRNGGGSNRMISLNDIGL
jgi:hypothetical protein